MAPRPRPAPPPAFDWKNLNQDQLAEVLGPTTRSIRGWIKTAEGTDLPFPRHQGIRKTSDAYCLTKVIDWLIKDAARGASTKAVGTTAEEQSAATLRKTLAEAETKELELQLRKGQLVEVGDLELTWTSALARFKSTLLGSRASLAEDVLRLEQVTFVAIAEIYDKVIYAALTDLSELKADEASEVQDIEIPVETAE